MRPGKVFALLAFAGLLWFLWLAGDTPAQIITYSGPPFPKQITIADNTPTALLTVAVPNLGACNFLLAYSARAADAANSQTHTGLVSFAAVANALGAVTANTDEETENVVVTSGTLADTWTATVAANTANLVASFNTSLNVPVQIRYTVLHPLGCVTTFH